MCLRKRECFSFSRLSYAEHCSILFATAPPAQGAGLLNRKPRSVFLLLWRVGVFLFSFSHFSTFFCNLQNLRNFRVFVLLFSADVGNILFSLANVLFYTRYRCFCRRFMGFIPFRGQSCFAQILTVCKQKGENRAKMSPNVRVCPQMSAFVRFCPRLTHVKVVI